MGCLEESGLAALANPGRSITDLDLGCQQPLQGEGIAGRNENVVRSKGERNVTDCHGFCQRLGGTGLGASSAEAGFAERRSNHIHIETFQKAELPAVFLPRIEIKSIVA